MERRKTYMFSKFKNPKEILHPTVTDPHVTSPGHEASVITRKEIESSLVGKTSEIYERARQIYDRAKRTARRRSSGII